MTPSELIGRVPDLPSLPEVYFQVDRVLQDPDFSLQELSEVIEREPAIAARLLRLANSALYGFSGHIDTIQRAVTMIGSDEIRDLILSSAVLSAFKRMPVGAVSMRSFWEHSIACGLAARNIAALTGAANMQRYYIYGLLHDIGRLVLFLALPQRMGDLLIRHRNSEGHLVDLEHDALGFTHETVGGTLLEGWRLPRALVGVVARHHCNGEESGAGREAAVVHFADLTVNAMSMGSSGTRLVPELDERAWERVGLEVDEIPILCADTLEQFENVVAAFFD
ncbi:MAG: hypothetical protein B0D88_01105 [Candidatus Sedimenticola endophacoides]|nr:MAG: hypothetical protein B0D94_06885 [Candidatus Sedimenticola endophacoides]OQX39402.1 MAG: hypothetical protein B0D89_10835 [Candidatus Sedimenticola endophacoides]OQX45107.1 MAG: hypothetical protein B0D88_01105 [Candidatus Sedimenticola endophacoides]